MAEPAAFRIASPARVLARGEDWSVSEFVCTFGPDDKPFEEQHQSAAISAVMEGAFRYRTQQGGALLHPGAVMLGNPGACYECGHDHGRGDRCIAFHYTPDFFAEIAASAAGSGRFRFAQAMLPAGGNLMLPLVEIEAAVRQGGRLALEELVVRVAETVISAASGMVKLPITPAPHEARRIVKALRHIEGHAGEPLELADLAAVACMSKYHFLRSFRRVVGMTPYQYLLHLRLRRAALGLATTPEPVASVAYNAGFGDLSTFNGRFRAAFGTSPSGFRRARAILQD